MDFKVKLIDTFLVAYKIERPRAFVEDTYKIRKCVPPPKCLSAQRPERPWWYGVCVFVCLFCFNVVRYYSMANGSDTRADERARISVRKYFNSIKSFHHNIQSSSNTTAVRTVYCQCNCILLKYGERSRAN